MNPESNSAPKPAQSKGRVFDVMRPGKAPAPPTSHPGIIGHTPKVRNTMEGVSGIGEPDPLMNAKKKVVVQPVEAAASPKKDTETAAGAMAVKVAAPKSVETPVPDATSEPTPEMPAKQEAPPEPAVEPPAPLVESTQALEALEPPVPPPPAPASGQAPQEAATSTPEPDHGDVVVSHHGAPGSGMQIVLLVLCILLIAVVALDIALDAGLFRIPGLPHTSFF